MRAKKLFFLLTVLLTMVFCASPAMAGLKGHWKLDDTVPGTDPNLVEDPNDLITALDEVGPGNNNGILTNGPVWVSGKSGYAVDFDGTNYVDMGYAPSLNMGTGNVSITAWVKFGALSAHGAFAGKGLMSDDSGYGFVALNTGQVAFQARQGLNVREVYSNETGGAWVGNVNDEQWHHVVGVLEREQVNGARIYVDGVLQVNPNSVANTIGYTANLNSETARFCVGARYSDIMAPAVLWQFDGSVDDVQVYSRHVLTQEDIDFLYANPGVAIEDAQCGDWGYLSMDFDKNCYVDLADFADFASDWMKCTHPGDAIHCAPVN